MEGGRSRKGSFGLIPGFLALGLWWVHFSCVEPFHCPSEILPSRLNKIFSARQDGYTLTSRSVQLLDNYWLLHFEAAPFKGIPVIHLWAWVPIVPLTTELLLEFTDHRRSFYRFSLGSFPIVLQTYHSQSVSIVEMYCLLVYWMELIPTLIEEGKSLPTGIAAVGLKECMEVEIKRDTLLLVISSPDTQPAMFHQAFVQNPIIPNLEELILNVAGQNHQELDLDQFMDSLDKLCHLKDRIINLHRAPWGECIVAPKIFNLAYCQGICPADSRELHESNFQCFEKKPDTCLRFFRVCGPTDVRILSFMVLEDNYRLNVHHMNISVVEGCGCL